MLDPPTFLADDPPMSKSHPFAAIHSKHGHRFCDQFEDDERSQSGGPNAGPHKEIERPKERRRGEDSDPVGCYKV